MTSRRKEQSSFATAVVLVGILAAYCASRFSIVNELTYFLPVGADPATAQLARAVSDSELSRVLVFTVGGERGEATAATRMLATALSRQPGIAWVDSGPSPNLHAEIEKLYWPRRYGFYTAAGGDERLSDADLTDAARRLKQTLGGPFGPIASRMAGQDPLLAFATFSAGLADMRIGNLVVEDGQYVTADGRWSVVLCATAASALDADRQQRTLAGVEAAIDEVRDAHRAVTIEYTGVARFAVRSKELILRDVTRVGVVSSIAVVGVLFVLFGSAGLVLASAAVVAAGMLSGLAAVLLIYGQVHALTLGIGATLIGVCEDYPIHYLNHELRVPHANGPRAGMRVLWPPLVLGAATSMLGFSTFALTTYAGLREVALFACAGIAGAMAVTWLMLPPIVQLQRGGRRYADTIAAAMRRLPWPSLPVLPPAVLPVLALATGLVGLPYLKWEGSLASLNQLDREIVATDTRVRARAMAVEPGRLVVALGDDEEAALRLNDRVARRLAEQVTAGALGGYSSLHAILRSQELQRASWEAVHVEATLGPRFMDALAAEGFRVEEFDDFLKDLRGSTFDPITRASLEGTSFERLARMFRIDVGNRTGVLTFVRGVADPAGLEAAVADLDGVVVVDQKHAMDAAYAGYQAELLRLFCAGMIGVFVLTAFRYGGVRRAAVVCTPALIAVVFTVGALSLVGVALNLMHLAALVLVFSMGVDYGIFLEECSWGESVRAATMQSIVLASSTTILSFGLLVLSQIPALRAVGETTGLGILMSAILAPHVLALRTGGGMR